MSRIAAAIKARIAGFNLVVTSRERGKSLPCDTRALSPTQFCVAIVSFFFRAVTWPRSNDPFGLWVESRRATGWHRRPGSWTIKPANRDAERVRNCDASTSRLCPSHRIECTGRGVNLVLVGSRRRGFAFVQPSPHPIAGNQMDVAALHLGGEPLGPHFLRAGDLVCIDAKTSRLRMVASADSLPPEPGSCSSPTS
jgi:hypothetical protein